MKKAIYPGSFDPVTNGHIDLIRRGLKVFDRIVVAVSENPHKVPLFTLKERVEMMKESLSKIKNAEVACFDGLLVKYAERRGINVIIRGLRVMSDFEYEFQMAQINHKLSPGVEIVYMVPAEVYTYISSSAIKELAMLGGAYDCLVPRCVKMKLREKFGR